MSKAEFFILRAAAVTGVVAFYCMLGLVVATIILEAIR